MEVLEANSIIEKINTKFGSDILGIQEDSEFITITVAPHKTVALINYLYNDPDLSYRFLTTLFAVHNPALSQMAMYYLLHNLEKNTRIRVKALLTDTNPEIETLTGIFAAANWLERETFDFFGVRFIGHPNLKRILNVEDMIIHPLRKEYPLEDQTREDKKDEMFGR